MATAPQAAMEMPQQGENPYNNPETMAVYDEMRKSVSSKEFGDELLSNASQANPEEVAKFRAALEQIDLPPEALDQLNNMVDEILANPENYDEIRAKYMEQGATDDILPEQFDAYFFTALNMAIDQMIAEPSGVQAFAKGGIAELTPVAKAIASYGRNGDTMLAHITPAEARMLRRRGGSGTINPNTGLPEFFLKKLFKGVGKALKSIGNAVKDFAKSSVGKIITTVALGFFLGPAAAGLVGATSTAAVAAVSGFVGSAGSTLLGGGNLKDALKAGAIGGLTAGAGAGIMGGADAFAAGSYTGPTTISGQFDRFTNAISGTPAPAANAAATTVPEVAPAAQAAPPPPAAAAAGANTAGATPVDSSFGNQLNMANPDYSPMSNTGMGGPQTSSFGSNPAVQFDRNLLPETFTGAPAPAASAATATTTGNAIAPSIQPTPTVGESLSTAGKGFMKMLPGTEGSFSEGFDQFTKGAGDLLSPGPSSADLKARAEGILGADTTGKMTYNDALKAAKAEGPGMFRSYAPATALGIGAIGAFGGFSPKAAPVSPYQDLLTGGPGSARDLLNKNPGRYYVQNLPGVTYYNGSVIKPPGMATGGEVAPRHFARGGFGDTMRNYMQEDGGMGDDYYARQQFEPDRFSTAPPPAPPSVASDYDLMQSGFNEDGSPNYIQVPKGAAGNATYTPPTPAPMATPKPSSYGPPSSIQTPGGTATFSPAPAPSYTGADGSTYAMINGAWTQTGGPLPSFMKPVDGKPTFIPGGQVGFDSNVATNRNVNDYFNLFPHKVRGADRAVASGRYSTPPANISFGSGTLPMGTSPNTGGIAGLRLSAQQQPAYTPMPVAPRATPASQNLPELQKDLTTERELGAKQARASKDYQFAMNDKKAAFMNMGGIAGLAQGGYPRRTGQIQGPGTATSDSIPAMLSDGEFVMTAKAVRGAGKGDRRAGAKRMYSLMHQLEKNAARG